MSAAIPTFAELAGDLEPRLIEASRLFRAVAAFHTRGEEGAKSALMGATDAAARENALRWLEAQIARAIAMAEMIEGPRADASDTSDWDMEVGRMLQGEPLVAYITASPMPRDADWPTLGKVAMDLCDPSIRGEATRTLRDMWWRAMQHEQAEARKRPGQFLASVGIVAEHVAEIVAEGPGVIAGGGPMLTLEQVGEITGAPLFDDAPEAVAEGEHYQGPYREHPPMPRRGDPAPRLPGAVRRNPPDANELKATIMLLGKANIAHTEGLTESLGISGSTWNNWLAGRNAPRIDVAKARILSAEIARLISDLEKADAVLREVVK